MQTVKVKILEFKEALRKNRKAHKKEFDEATISYRKAAILQLEKMLKDAQEGKEIKRYIELPEPEDHAEDYEREIRMAEMSADSVITLTPREFDTFIMDNWDWKQGVTTTNMFYKSAH
jgi:hypothetical protein